MSEFERPEFKRRGFVDQLNIETPEQVDLRFPVAGIGSRFVAVLIDHLIQFGVYILFGIAVAISTSGNPVAKGVQEIDTFGKWFIAAVIFINFLLLWGYFSLFEALWHGQTPGKRVMKLRVIKDSGRQITLFEALARNLLRFVDYLPGFYFTGVIAMLCNRKNKRLGDMAAGTLVVHELASDDRAADAFLGGEDFFARKKEVEPESGLPSDAVARLEPADLHVMETFFARALDLDLKTRSAIAAKIAARMAAKMRVPLPEGNPERALEAMARAMRGSGRRF
ncbi:MAG: RDD family protein [Acidobacteriaceae bacterium]